MPNYTKAKAVRLSGEHGINVRIDWFLPFRMIKIPSRPRRLIPLLLMALVCGYGFAQEAQPSAHISRYLGPGSCAAAACHGNVAPQSSTSVLQNEYSVWVVQDSHAKAFRSLQTPIAVRMGKLIGISKVDDSPRCLTCHALSVSTAQRGRNFDLNDGVSCESCHGPSSAWLGDHTTRGWTRQKSIAAGMYDNWNVVHRAEKCLSCHLGDKGRSVDHELIAAGHPALVFDLESYSAAMPPHWKPQNEPKDILRTWGVGQAVELREALHRLSRSTQSDSWPDYAEYECYACHHSLTGAEKSWRQEAGYQNRKAGSPPWDAAHFTVLRILARQTDPELSAELETRLSKVFKVSSIAKTDRQEVARAADAGAESADRIAGALKNHVMQRQDALEMALALAAEAGKISTQGPRSAEQAAMALESLAAATGGNKNSQFESAMKATFKELESPSSYNAPRFAVRLKEAAAALR